MRKYKVAIIGCGRPSAGVNSNMEGFSIAYAHANAYKAHTNATIVAAADISLENANALAAQFHIPNVYTDYKEMINKEKPDIISICTWPTLHKEMTCYAAEAGVSIILCEKPMAVGVDEVDEMLETCKKHGSRLFINHQRRYNYHLSIIRKMMDDRTLGQVKRLEAWVGDGWDLMSWGTHWVDIHRYFMHDSPVKWVLAQAIFTGKFRYGHPVEDHMLLQLQYENDVISFIHLGSHLNGAGLRVIGTEGSVSFVEGEQEISLVHNDDGKNILKRYMDACPSTHDMEEAIKDMITAVEQDRTCEIDGENGGRTTEVIMAAYQSAAERKKILFPLKSRLFNLVCDFTDVPTC